MSTPVVAWQALRDARGGTPAIASRQRARLAAMITIARQRSPYYRDLYKHLPSGVNDLRLLPPVTKPELMESFDGWVTDPGITREGVEAFVSDPALVGQEYLGRYMVWTTSGTTGEPALLVHDRRSLTVMTALSAVRIVPAWVGWRDLAALLSRGGRAASVWATGGHFFGATMAERQRLSRPWREDRIRIVSAATPLSQLVDELNAYRPAMLSGYASALVLLAEEQKAGRLRVRPAVMTVAGERLTPAMRRSIESAFGVPLRNNYSASEAGVIAFDCGHGWMHVNADWYVLEPVDEDYRPTPAGRPSRGVLLTNLANRAQPVIRYDLGDSVTVKQDPCPCGRTLPAIRVEGRTDDTLAFEAEDGGTVRLLPLALGSVVEETPGVRRFQAVKDGPRSLKVRLETEKGADEGAVWRSVETRTRRYLAAQGAATVSVGRDPAPPAPDPRSGKFRQVWAVS